MENYLLFIIWIVLQLFLLDVHGRTSHNKVQCDPTVNNSCPKGYCCVKEVYVSMDVTKPANGFTVCHRRLQKDEFCLHKAEGFLCQCDEGLTCVSQDVENNFGHCQHK
ncbi:hypothetical protein SNE40_018626 [Patella caerulea]|uniref:Uncharacterized protein n=1 Tax=Patella caerulea TaxID=87958 RepID=A0AAN8J5A0_PATCE